MSVVSEGKQLSDRSQIVHFNSTGSVEFTECNQ